MSDVKTKNVIYMLSGIPGCGKSTFCDNYTKLHPNTVHVSSDAIRKELFGSESDQQNGRLVFRTLCKRACLAIQQGKDVLLDATFVNPSARKSTMEILKDFHGIASPDSYEMKAIFFPVNYNTCLERNNSR